MTSVAHANSPLPIGFGAIKIGQPWVQVEGTVTYKDLTDESTLPERLGHECGYKSLVVTTDEGELLITTNDFIVTGLAYVTPIEQGSSVSSVADLVMQTYGQPRSAFMRNALGQATIDRDAVTHIELTYEAEHPVSFFISGDSLWQYQVSVQFNRARWHENKTNRCARNREKTLKGKSKRLPIGN